MQRDIVGQISNFKISFNITQIQKIVVCYKKCFANLFWSNQPCRSELPRNERTVDEANGFRIMLVYKKTFKL